MTDISLLQKTDLGKPNAYSFNYDPTRLFPVPRANMRALLGINSMLPFSGADYWTSYEFSWLNAKGKPQIAIAEFIIAADSINLIESKSFKLYLNSFHQTCFSSVEEVIQVLQNDLTKVVQGEVKIKLISPENFSQQKLQDFPGICLDKLDIMIEHYQHHPELLKAESAMISETVYTHLFKSNCPITNQYDWASILIRYSGKKIVHEALLQYLISYRQHNEFHEQCAERIFVDIMNQCRPEQLTVYARFTRRGGLDINPFRSNFEKIPENIRLSRQ